MINTTSNPRIRQIFTLLCLSIIFLLSIIIMGLVGVNGKVAYQNYSKGCLLYMTIDGDVVTYNNGFCLFPIVGAAVLAVLSLFFIIYWAMIIHRNDEFAPRPVSVLLLFISALAAMLAFAITAEIGIGLNKGCRILGDDINRCRKTKHFNALWGAEICAGMIGGLWLITMLLELFQFKSQPLHQRTTTADYLGTTTVVPHRAGDVNNHNLHNKNSVNYHNTTTTASSTVADSPYQQNSNIHNPTHVQKSEYAEPEMRQYPAYGQQQAQQQQYYAQQAQPHHPYVAPPHATERTHVVDSHPADANGISYGYQS